MATHALSIFGDHSDVMHARTTGWAMLAAGSVQEAHDFALVAHAATLRARVPFLHFFDGFRTSHEIDRIAVLGEDDIRALDPRRGCPRLPWPGDDARRADGPRHRAEPGRLLPGSRGRRTRSMPAVPGIVQGVMDELAARTGRRYGLVDYHGAPDAERVVLVMGSAAGAVEETVDDLVAPARRVGMLRLRLFHPFPAARSWPRSRRRCAPSRPSTGPRSRARSASRSTSSVVAALAEAMDRDAPPFAATPRVIGGRYGLSSKEMTPSMVKPIFDGAGARAAEAPLHRRHLRRRDASEPAHRHGFRHPRPAGEVQAVFFGLGSDGTVGANKASVKIIGEGTDLYAQGYFVYDSKKSGSVTVSHLRFGPEPIRSTYLVDEADFVACHQFGLLGKVKVLEAAKQGATFLLNSPYGPDEVWDHLPGDVQQPAGRQGRSTSG